MRMGPVGVEEDGSKLQLKAGRHRHAKFGCRKVKDPVSAGQ